jgi:hypothetical protein
MLLQFANREPFATSAASYKYETVTGHDESLRVILRVSIGEFRTSAFIDTGGVYLLCSPEVAQHIQLDSNLALPAPPLLWRNNRLAGTLHRIPLTFFAHQGNSLTIEATAFVPHLSLGQVWPSEFPCILGMNSCLERLRFAVDPFNDTFYFGELAGD